MEATVADQGFNIVEKMLGLTLLGTEWVLWLLLILSVVSVAIMLERFLFFVRMKLDFAHFSQQLTAHLVAGEWDAAKGMCENSSSLEAQTALRGIEYQKKGPKAQRAAMEGFLVGQRQVLDRGLVILGTLGNNAPFIGLFGTVIGIIMAFNDLANNPAGGPSVVMAGISEALVATAVGLIVAIPAVIAFNAFNRIVKRRMQNAESVVKIFMTYFS